MQVLYPRCAGHKDTIVACVRCVSAPQHHELRSFAATTTGLLALADWLAMHGCTHVAMEATGIYWKPVWHILEGSVRAGPGQCPPYPQRPGTQDRRQRRDVDRRSARARPDPLQLRTALGDTGTTRPHPHAQTTRARDRPAQPAHPESA